MHELSIATSILDLARRYVPTGMVLRTVHIRAGDLRGIDSGAMDFAWRACTLGIDAEGSTVDLQIIPGDALQLISIEVNENAKDKGSVQ